MLINSPVGTALERASGDIWPGHWFDATGFATHYRLYGNVWAYHTGADLNLNVPAWDSDKNAPVYAVADGTVTFSGVGTGTWGWIIIIKHTHPNGSLFYSRSAHVNHFQFPVVSTGAKVSRGQVIAHIGDADGKFPAHLHFDISHTNILQQNASHWPGNNLADVHTNYSDPRQFIMNNWSSGDQDTGNTEKMRVIATWLRIRPTPNTSMSEVGWLDYNDIVHVQGITPADGYHFARIP